MLHLLRSVYYTAVLRSDKHEKRDFRVVRVYRHRYFCGLRERSAVWFRGQFLNPGKYMYVRMLN